MNKRLPLVSIMIPNRNHASFLDQCIESALYQTYCNIEIILLDNCSDDNSMEVASRYIDKGVRVCKNPHNIVNKNYNVLSLLAEGDYIMLLCADDLLKPKFIEKCVNIMEQHQNVGYVHCDRDYIDASGNITELDPFYSCSFIAPGQSVLPIYMLTDVAQPAQCLMRRAAFNKILGYDTEIDHTNADKDLWFRLSLVSDYAYIREKFSLIRIHESRETTAGFRRFFHPLAIYLMQDIQAKWGELEGYEDVMQRLPAAHRKLSSESLQIALSCLMEGDAKLAKKYLIFSQLVFSEIVDDENYKLIQTIISNSLRTGEVTMPKNAEQNMFLSRKRSYDPPGGYTAIEVRS